MVHTSEHMVRRARDLRRRVTRAEERLWQWLRDRRFDGHKFRRQYPVGPYVLDFYCADLRVAFEIDGEEHDVPCVVDADSRRTRYLEARGIRVVRIRNVELIRDSTIVEDIIRWAIGKR